MNSKPCVNCPTVFPYADTYKSAFAALKRTNIKGLKVSEIMAVAFKESQFNGFFTGKETLYKSNMLMWTDETKLSAEDLLAAMLVGQRAQSWVIPKFRYEESYAAPALELGRRWGLNQRDSLLLACSAGIGQKILYIYVAENSEIKKFSQVIDFCYSPALQWNQICHDVAQLLKDSDGNLKLAATRYNAGPGAHLITSYGVQVAAFEVGFEGMLEKAGLQTCLV